MFEAHVVNLLRHYLGEYVRNIPDEALQISVWKGDVVLKDLQLKAEALNALKLPITVKAGFLGSVRLKVPWSRLGQEPVIVLLDRIYLLAEPAGFDLLYQGDDGEEAQQEAKKRRIEATELAMLQSKDRKRGAQETERRSWFGSLAATVMGNLKISITNVHIRYEDAWSNPGHTFCTGLTLEKLAAVTIDENGMETFVTSGAMDRLRKALQLDRLSIYHDSNSEKWQLGKKWDDLTAAEWREIFEPGIANDGESEKPRGEGWAAGRQYLLHPVGGTMRYLRQGKKEKRTPDVPYQKAGLVLDEANFTISENQYEDAMKLLEAVGMYRKKADIAFLRPRVPVHGNGAAWWTFAHRAILHKNQKLRRRVNWGDMYRLCQLRRRYLQVYAAALQTLPPDVRTADNQEIREMDDELSEDVILLWRMLAHTTVDRMRPKQEGAAQRPARRGWIGWLSGRPVPSEAGEQSAEDEEGSQGLTQEEWAKLDELVSYEPGKESALLAGQEAPNMLQIAVDVTMQRNTMRAIDSDGHDVLWGSFDTLKMGLQLYPKMVKCDVNLAYYGLSAPEGTLIESVSRRDKKGALSASYVQDPLDQKLDWMLQATMSSSHVTVWRASVDRFIKFLKSGQAVSPEVAKETAAVLQSKLEDVRRQAKEQLQNVLQQRKRFYIDLDVDAPKIALPTSVATDGSRVSQLLLDLGHFTLKTDQDEEENADEQETLYTRFKITGTDISAFLADGDYDWSRPPPLPNVKAAVCPPSEEEDTYGSTEQPAKLILPVLDRCGMSAVLHQMMITHPSYPTTRIAVWLPRLGFHFSPARFGRLMKVLRAVLPAKVEESSSLAAVDPSWLPGDFSGSLWEFSWSGMGSTTAAWEPRWAVLSGSYLYLLEQEDSKREKRLSRLVGKKLIEVPPELIGGIEHVIAITRRGTDPAKVVRSEQSVILRCKSSEDKAEWLDRLAMAMYKSSAPASLSVIDDEVEEEEPGAMIPSFSTRVMPETNQQLVYIIGALDQLQLSIGGMATDTSTEDEEIDILCLGASGGKVELLQRQSDLAIGIGVHELEIEDLLQGPENPSARYLAHSLLSNPDEGNLTVATVTGVLEKMTEGVIPHSPPSMKSPRKEQDDDEFADAEDFLASPDSMPSTPRFKKKGGFKANLDTFFDAEDLVLDDQEPSMDSQTPSFGGVGYLLPGGSSNEDQTLQATDFVKMQLLMLQPASSDYDGTDMKMIITMTTLEFYLNRPTVAALMDLGGQLSRAVASAPAASQSPAPEPTQPVAKEKPIQGGKDKVLGPGGLEPSVVKGLLGRGKIRVVFQLSMDMERARVFLNLEDGSQLAMLEQERISMDIKLFPGSMRVSASMGNLRFCNMLLGPEHQYGWFCDLRDPGSTSLVQIEFSSYNPDDDDYEGFEYSLTGKLSAVRIVFLYRFISELTAYFMALVAPGAQQAVVRVVDAVGGIERFIQQSEMTGSSGVKLDISLDAPVLIMPRNSTSSDFMQIGLGHLQVSSKVEWRGGTKEDPSAVRVDVITIESRDVNVGVGINGNLRDPMVPEMAGLTITVQRALRDLFKRLPAMVVHVQMNRLRAVMSDREYTLITECALANMAEPPQLPPNFRKPRQASLQPMASKGASEKVDKQPAAAEAYTTMRVVVDVQHAELEIFTGYHRDTSLALLQIQGLWLQYRATSNLEREILVTLPKISIIDCRADTRPEMRLALGSVLDAEREQSAMQPKGLGGDPANLTMLVMNMTYKPGTYSVVMRIQRPRMLVAMDFLLAVGEFFVPSLAAVAGNESDRDVREDPIGMQRDILLQSCVYKQTDSTTWLSPQRQLLADAPDVDEYEYDGAGNTLCLLQDANGLGVSGPPPEPLIVVGNGKKLRFKNVFIQNGRHLDECVHLGSGSSYSATPEDGVVVDGSGVDASYAHHEGDTVEEEKEGSGQSQPTQSTSNFGLDVQAIAPELTFYDSTKWSPSTQLRPEKLLRMKLDLNLLLAYKGSDRWLKASLKGVMVENAAGLTVLEPLDAVMDYASVQGKTMMEISCTDLALRIPLNVIRLMQRLSADLSAAMKLGGGAVTIRCSNFDRVWQTPPGGNASQMVTFWRPRAPRGYAIIGDCATAGKEPPSQAVLAVSTGFRRVRRPRSFKLLWSSKGMASGEECCVWLPTAPPGYAALGCVVTKGRDPPHPGTIHCVREDLLATSSISECVFFDPRESNMANDIGGPASMWRIDNSLGTFFACQGLQPPQKTVARDLREELRITGLPDANSTEGTTDSTFGQGQPTSSTGRSASARDPAMLRSSRPTATPSHRQHLTTPSFERIWWDKGGDSKRHLTIWRPHAPSGYVILGDAATEGYDPPDSGLVVRSDEDSGRLATPVDFAEKAVLAGRGWEEATVWFPIAPPGYVALGCVVAKGREPPSLECVRCVRMDVVSQTTFAGKPVWSWEPPSSGPAFSFWPVKNQVNTFIVHADQKKPPWRMAYNLAELEKPKQPENLDAQIKTTRISCTVFDDLTGVMTPIMDTSITGVHLTVHGRPEALNAVVFTSVAASTFNTQLGVWEPLIEPFDGIFKYESRDESLDSATGGGGTHVRITTTSVVNVNITSAGMDACAGAALSWNKVAELEHAARQGLRPGQEDVNQEAESAALDREEGLKLMVDNQLGAPLYARTAQDGYTTVQPIPFGRATAVPLPPLRFPELLSTTSPDSVSRQVRRFIAVRVLEAKDLAAGDEISLQEYVCQLMVVHSSTTSGEQTKQLPQTARSRGVQGTSLRTDETGRRLADAIWNEVFVFEVPPQPGAKLELRVINQAANTGKGAPVGAAAFPMDSTTSSAPSAHWGAVKTALAIGRTSWQNVKERKLPLQPPRKQGADGKAGQGNGSITVADYSFSVGISGRVQTPESLRNELETYQAMDTVLQLASSPEGPWTGMRSMTAIMTVPMSVDSRFLAMEMSMRQGLKCVSLRSLAVLWNSTDVELDVCVCPRNLLESDDTTTVEKTEDEIYENQRYQPLLGWGSAWPGHLLPSDPGRYSGRDLSKSSQEINVTCPNGWEYVDNWNVDRALGGSDGWFYGPDFKSLKGPITSASAHGKKGPFDFVRRRRLVRMRERHTGASTSQKGRKDPERLSLGVLEPGASLPLPWSSLLAGSDWCLQLRPSADSSSPQYKWSRVVPPASSQASGGNRQDDDGRSSKRWTTGSAFVLSELSVAKEVTKREELLECMSSRESWWLCVEADPSRLHSEVSTSVIDWRLTVRAPLKLENRLPVMAEFFVWEKASRSAVGVRPVSRQHGLVEAGGSVHVYSVDIRCQILLTWLPQGGWKHDKEAVLISDPWASDLPGNFWMVKAQSNRRLRVSLENDMGGSEVAAKIVRLFVPYWLRNDAEVPLSCRLVEIEPPSIQQTDSKWLQLASKAAKSAEVLPEHSSDGGASSMAKKVIRSLEAIEDAQNSQPIMLSLPAVDNVGLAVALNPAGVFSSAIALKAFEDKMERVEIRAVDSNAASYMKLSVALDLSSLGYERTKVVCLQPHTVFTNRLGQSLFMRQTGGQQEMLLSPTDARKPLLWESVWQPELLQVRMDGCNWSLPFKVNSEGTLYIVMLNSSGNGSTIIRAEVGNGVDSSRFLVVFRWASHQPPYKIENRSSILPVRFRQAGTGDDAWEVLQAGSTLPFAWVDITGKHLLEVMVDGADSSTAWQINIDEEAEHDPSELASGRPVAAVSVAVQQEISGLMCVRIGDWRPSDHGKQALGTGSSRSSSGSRDESALTAAAASTGLEEEGAEKKLFVMLHLDEFGISIVDHTPEELLYISMQAADLSYDTNVSGGSRVKLRIGHIQIDNQLPLTAMPVLLTPQPARGTRDEYVLKLTVASQKRPDEEFYPYIGLQLPSGAWLVNIHEPIIWRLHAMLRKLNLGRLSSSSQTTAVAVDPMVQVGLLNISEGRLKLTLAMAPSQRPRGILGLWSTLITSLGNTDEMPIRITQKVRENIQMRKSQISGATASAVSNDLLSQPFQLLSGVDVLGNASSALGHVSEGVAALSMDKTFIRSRQNQESKATIEGLGDGLREGGEALAKGLFRGVTGILTKPVEGAQESGLEGFVAGFGKGLVGVAAQPMSGVLDLVSKTTDGVNASRLKLSAAMSAKMAYKRHRLPRAVGGDGILKPYDEYAARGQIILQLAERGALFGTTAFDLKERAKFAMSDAYEEHFNLPGKSTLMVTNQRCMLLQHPSSGMGNRTPDLLKDPCSILWDVAWDELMTIELKEGKSDAPSDSPSRLVIHLRHWSQDSRLFDTKQIARMLQCHPGTTQALEIREAIQRAMAKYGPDRATVAAQTKKRRAESRPYTGAAGGAASGAALGLLAGPAAPVVIPLMAGFGALVGGAGQIMLESDSQEGPSLRTSVKESRDTERRVGPRSTSTPSREDMGQWTGQIIRSFKLVWWDKGALWSNKYPVSIWRPIPPPGFVSVGDLATAGHEQPEKAMVYRDDGDGKFALPDGYDLIWRDTDSGAKTPVTIWMPRPPRGYVAVGAVAVPDYYEPEPETVHCVRQDCTAPAQLGRTIWRDRQGAALWKCSLWAVVNDARTFLARRDHESPIVSQCFTIAV